MDALPAASRGVAMDHVVQPLCARGGEATGRMTDTVTDGLGEGEGVEQEDGIRVWIDAVGQDRGEAGGSEGGGDEERGGGDEERGYSLDAVRVAVPVRAYVTVERSIEVGNHATF